MPDTIIDVYGLTKTYRPGFPHKPVQAVKNLALAVARGSIVAFVGPNGAGKTTTIHSVLGFLRPDKGTIRVFGMPPGPAALRRIGYQPEIFNTYPFYKARETLRFHGRLSGIAREDIDRATIPLLERLGIADAADRKVATFSKGMTQRLGLAQALLHDPELLILDEPTSGLDPQGRRLVLDIIREEKQKGRTIFLSSHILADVERTCDEVVMFMKGEVAFAERIGERAAAADDWEIEVQGWTGEAPEWLAGHAFTLVAATGTRAVIACDAVAKKPLLATIVATPLDITAVRPRRHSSLEERYLAQVGQS